MARDYVGIARRYAQKAAKGGPEFGKWTTLAAKRYLEDLKRAKKKGAPFAFCAKKAVSACKFVELMPHVKGVWDSKTIIMDPWQVWVTASVFGFRNPDGSRRFTTALLAVARKNAKTTWAAAIGLYCLCYEEPVGPEVYAAANTGTQARIPWGVAKHMVAKTSALREHFMVEAMANAIPCMQNGGTFKPINAKASTQDGLNPSALIFDEVHAQKTPELINVLRSAAGARKNPLYLYTTTEGYENLGPWRDLRHFCRQVLEGVVEADHFFGVIFAVDDKDDEFDEAVWIKANPLLASNPILLTELRKEAIEAKAMPSKAAEFRIKRCNRPSAHAGGWVDIAKWQACSGTVPLDALEGYPCIAGLDLANTRDLNSLRFLWDYHGKWVTHGWRWVPSESVHQRSSRGMLLYEQWAEAGLIEVFDSATTKYSVIEDKARELADRFGPKWITFDKYNADELVARMLEDGYPMLEFVQGVKSFHPAMRDLEKDYLAGNLMHGGDPVLTWCASNLVPRYNTNMSMMPDKRRSPEKIDDMVALLMCRGVAGSPPEDEKKIINQGFVEV